MCDPVLQGGEWMTLYTLSNNTKDPRLVRACFGPSHPQLHHCHAAHLRCRVHVHEEMCWDTSGSGEAVCLPTCSSQIPRCTACLLV